MPKRMIGRKRGRPHKSPKPHVPTAAQLKAAFTPVRERRRKIAGLRYTSPSMRPERAPQNLAALVAKAGVDFAVFEILRVKREADLKRRARERRAALIRQSSANKAVLAREVAGKRRLADLFPPGPHYPYYQTLDHPELIWATSNATFSPPHIEAYNSWGKFKVDDDESGFAELGFYFTWTNAGEPVVINADAYLVANGSCEASVPSGYGYGAYNLADLYLYAELEPWLWGPSPVAAPAVFEHVLTLRPKNSSLWPLPYSEGETLIESVFRGYDLRAESLVVPRNGVMVFEVLLEVWYSILGGHIVVDFSSDAFNVLAPAVLITVLRPIETGPVVSGWL